MRTRYARRLGRGEKPRREHERLVVVGPLVDGSRAQERAQLLAEVLALALGPQAGEHRLEERAVGLAGVEPEGEPLEPVRQEGHLVDALGRDRLDPLAPRRRR